MAATERDTAVIVVNFASSDFLEPGLAPMATWESPPRIVVVDNYSGDDERRRVVELADRSGWDAIPSPTNGGFGAGANRGAAAAIAAGASTLVVLNPDATIGEADFSRMIRASREQPWALLSPRITKPGGASWFDGAIVDLATGRTMSARKAQATSVDRSMPWISGACLVTSAALWTALDGFDEDFFLYWEDVDISARALRLGAALRVVDDAVAFHAEGGTQHQKDVDRSAPWTRSETYYYYMIRNRLLFAARNLSATEMRAWSESAWRSAYEVLQIGGRRKFLRPMMPLRAAYRGVRDGRAFISDAQAAPTAVGRAQ